MISPIPSYGPSSDFAGQKSSSNADTSNVDKNMFMRLMIAQLRNQDPLNPSSGTEFVGQLAQFQQLEQSVNSGQDLTSIRQDLDQIVAAVNRGATIVQP